MIRSHELEFELDDESECELEDELEYELLGAVGRRHIGPRQRPKSLRDAIPDDPNYQKYIPIDYRLDTKRIVDFAEDLPNGQSGQFWVDLAHRGVAAADMSHPIGGLALAGPVLAVDAPALALTGTLT